MTITEASHTNRLLRWLGVSDDRGRDRPTDQEAHAAAAYLAARAHKALAAGIGPDDVHRHWPSVRNGQGQARYARELEQIVVQLLNEYQFVGPEGGHDCGSCATDAAIYREKLAALGVPGVSAT